MFFAFNVKKVGGFVKMMGWIGHWIWGYCEWIWDEEWNASIEQNNGMYLKGNKKEQSGAYCMSVELRSLVQLQIPRRSVCFFLSDQSEDNPPPMAGGDFVGVFVLRK